MKTTTSARFTNQLRAICLALLAAVTAAFAPQSASAKGQVPIRGTFDTEFDSTVLFPIAYVRLTREGNATHLGLTAIETANENVNLLTGEGTATVYFTAANGDQA